MMTHDEKRYNGVVPCVVSGEAVGRKLLQLILSNSASEHSHAHSSLRKVGGGDSIDRPGPDSSANQASTALFEVAPNGKHSTATSHSTASFIPEDSPFTSSHVGIAGGGIGSFTASVRHFDVFLTVSRSGPRTYPTSSPLIFRVTPSHIVSLPSGVAISVVDAVAKSAGYGCERQEVEVSVVDGSSSIVEAMEVSFTDLHLSHRDLYYL
eukprot:Lankesteria_metandrocarpae@DN5900_c0_g1_i1.p1